jgi:tetratricopeptide (TPR) repeat protein
MDQYVRNDYDDARTAFNVANALDTTFVLPLLYKAFCDVNQHRYAAADSLLHRLEGQRSRLSDYNQDWLEFELAQLAGRVPESLAAIRRAARLAPTSKATYNFAVRALEARYPVLAESALRQLSPDVGPMRGWMPYWDVLTSALHVRGRHRAELETAREERKRFPARFEPYTHEARALAAQGNTLELERLWQLAASAQNATPAVRGTLAYDIGEELRAHGDSVDAKPWFERAYGIFSSDNDSGSGARWGRARAGARTGRLAEALGLGEMLISADSGRSAELVGFAGITAARTGHRGRAQQLLEQLAEDKRPYQFGEPQYHAGRIAAALGDTKRAAALLAEAYARGLLYDMELHRDDVLVGLRGQPILDQLAARD